MEELRFQITEETEDERIDKCMSLLVLLVWNKL